MSTETIAPPVVKKKVEQLLSKRRRKIVTDPLNEDNPITVQVLGICSALAVTTQLIPTFVMTIVSVLILASLKNSFLYIH